MTCNADPAAAVVNVFVAAMLQIFNPAQVCPPDGGGSTNVRFFAGDTETVFSFIPQPGNGKCEPLLWVRLSHRTRSRLSEFPAAFTGNPVSCKPADVVPVLAVEVGVGRCALVDERPNWDALATEAEISFGDSWRIESVLRVAAATLRELGQFKRAVATDTVAPYGPAGGIVAWTGLAYVEFRE